MTNQKLTQIPVVCPWSAVHLSDPGQLVALFGSHVMTQNDDVVKGTHCTAGSSAAMQSVVCVQVCVHAYPLMAPPPKENFWQTSPVFGHVIIADVQAVSYGEPASLPASPPEELPASPPPELLPELLLLEPLLDPELLPPLDPPLLLPLDPLLLDEPLDEPLPPPLLLLDPPVPDPPLEVEQASAAIANPTIHPMRPTITHSSYGRTYLRDRAAVNAAAEIRVENQTQARGLPSPSPNPIREIDRQGHVADARDDGSTLPDADVVACIVKGFADLSFPKPDGGIVMVVYPMAFAPGE